MSWAPGWYSDPFQRFEVRYWDGTAWTHDVSSAGRQASDPPHVSPAPPPPATPQGWYPDPWGAFALRYWDGHRWTEHGSARGPQAAAYGASSAFHPRALVSDPKVQRQVQKVGIHAPGAAQAAIFHEPILVVNQKAKLIGNRAD